MNDPRLVRWKFRAEDDNHLSKGAMKLAMRLAGAKIRDRNFAVDSEFPLPWSQAQWLTGLCQRQCYYLLKELQRKSYIRLSRRKVGSPPTNFYFFTFLPWKPPQSMRKFIEEKEIARAKRAVERASDPKSNRRNSK